MIKLAHKLAKNKFGQTFPNPTVGCIIVKNRAGPRRARVGMCRFKRRFIVQNNSVEYKINRVLAGIIGAVVKLDARRHL